MASQLYTTTTPLEIYNFVARCDVVLRGYSVDIGAGFIKPNVLIMFECLFRVTFAEIAIEIG